MPIYAYKCSACGFAKDTLQKLSDAPLTVCPECGRDTYAKQVTAAGFQLKGSGWYVTDFRNNGASSGKSEGAVAKPEGAAAGTNAPAAPAAGTADSGKPAAAAAETKRVASSPPPSTSA